jgi:hypothetical protein
LIPRLPRRAARGLFLFGVCCLGVFPALAAGWDIPRLMAALAANPGGRAQFVEKKYLAVLDAPIESSGELVYVAPERLERHTARPRAESMVLDGDALSLTRDGRTLNLRLRDYPEAAAFIASIRGTLAGDRAALERNFALSLSGTAARWTLTLLPSDARLASLVLRISVEGSGGQVRQVDILQADGDRSVLQIEPVLAAPGGRQP